MSELSFGRDGAQRFRCALSASETARIIATLPEQGEAAGLRLTGIAPPDGVIAQDGPLQRIAAALIGKGARPVRAVLFDKTTAGNWSLPWHQDRTVVVRERHDTPEYGPWSVKTGLLHVAPPIRILEGMATLRLHLDDVDADNAPLLISPGSHRLGRLNEAEIPAVVARLGTHACLADTGDVWAYSTPILHASKAVARPGRRRVLQLDFANRPLDGLLEWLGV